MFQKRVQENMDKKIGKILLACLFSFIISAQEQSIKLYLQDITQNPIRQVETGVPFLLQVVIDNVDGVGYPDDIPGFEQFEVSKYGSSQSTSVINGLKTERTILNYVLKSDRNGSYKIGPLSAIGSDNKKITSDILHFHVGDKTVTYNLKKQPYFLQVDVDKKSVYVGQTINLSIRFYYVHDFDDLKIIAQNFEHVHVGQSSQDPIDGQEMTRGQEYRYKEWNMQLYPEKEGRLVIPSIQAVYRTPSNGHGFAGLFDVFGMNSEKTVYSAPRSIEAKQLPESKAYGKVTAIGQFDKAIFSLQKQEGEVGEGVVATLQVVGNGNMEMIQAPKLDLPEGLRYYESNSSVHKISDELFEKRFEYILQSDRPEDFIISSQTFAYFDPVTEAYKILETNKISLNIVQGTTHKLDSQHDNKQTDDADQQANSKQYIFKDGQIDFINQSGMFFEYGTESMMHRMIPWLLMLIILVSLLAGLYWLYLSFVTVSIFDYYWVSYLIVRYHTYRAYQRQDLYALYQEFLNLCKKYDLDLHGAKISETFKHMNFSDQKIKDWYAFLQQMMHVLFSGKSILKRDKQKLLQQSMMWLPDLLACCRVIYKESKQKSIHKTS